MKYVKDSATVITELMIPAYANFGGKVHGGILLSLMDKVAYACATQHAQAYCVTVAVEGVEFLSPVEVGDLVSIKAMVNYVGNTTMIIGMRVDALNPKTGVSRHTNSCYFTMAAKSDDGQLLQVPGLILETETELRRFCEARIIKQMSKQRRSLLLSDLKDSSIEMLREACVGERCIVEIR